MKPSTQNLYRERIERVLAYIHDHLDHAISLEELAQRAHFSMYHFHRVFRALVGESVMELVRRFRLERAAHRLRHTDAPVTAIAFDAGYEAHESFTRAFQTRFGMSPTQFRNEVNGPGLPVVPSGLHFQPEGDSLTWVPVIWEKPMLPVEIRTLPAMNLACVRHTGPYMECGRAWEQLMQWAGPRGLCGPQTRCLGICYDDPDTTAAAEIRYDACLSVHEGTQASPPAEIRHLPGGEYAVATHRGPYDGLHAAWNYVFAEWLPKSGRTLRDSPAFEVYLNNPQTTPPADLATEICVPIG